MLKRVNRTFPKRVATLLWRPPIFAKRIFFSTEVPKNESKSNEFKLETRNAAFPPEGEETNQDQKTKKQSKFYRLWKEYGVVFLILYFGIYFATLALVYVLVSSGVLLKGDAISLVKRLGLDKWFNVEDLNPTAGNATIAWILTKFTEPLRFLLTTILVPLIAKKRRLR